MDPPLNAFPDNLFVLVPQLIERAEHIHGRLRSLRATRPPGFNAFSLVGIMPPERGDVELPESRGSLGGPDRRNLRKIGTGHLLEANPLISRMDDSTSWRSVHPMGET